jgi:ribosomal protein S18 acetylase RimI-like enzyme
MEIVNLRTVRPRTLEPLFQEQAVFWSEQFLWDYRPALDMIRRFLEARSLEGFAAMENGLAAAYCFYVLEDRKGLIGDCFIAPRFSGAGLGLQLLAQVLAALTANPSVSRIETHILPPDPQVQDFLTAQHFHLSERQFMRLKLGDIPRPAAPQISGLLLEPFHTRYTAGGARLIQLAYATHVDGEINDQYRSEAGADRFIRNLMQTPASGHFLREASFILRPRSESQPAGMVLASRVAPHVAHITQICVLPGYQHNGLGRRLMQASIQALQEEGYRELTLTVTSSNISAVRLYESLGFRTIRRFFAGVWQA